MRAYLKKPKPSAFQPYSLVIDIDDPTDHANLVFFGNVLRRHAERVPGEKGGSLIQSSIWSAISYLIPEKDNMIIFKEQGKKFQPYTITIEIQSQLDEDSLNDFRKSVCAWFYLPEWLGIFHRMRKLNPNFGMPSNRCCPNE
jgi:hypothetical protein